MNGKNLLEMRELQGLLTRTKSTFAARDQRMQDVLAVRQGRMRDVFPALFPEGPFDKGIVANMVDVAARDLSEVLAPLPAFNCASAKSTTDTARMFAEKRTRIVNGYIDHSSVQVQMYTAADRYFTYGFVPSIIELDPETNMPRITFLDSIGAYPVFDRLGEIQAGFFQFWRSRDELAAQYPHAAGALENHKQGNDLVEVVRYHDRTVDMIFLPNADSMILESAPNVTGECLLEWTQRPGVDNDSHGQFDDVLAVQVAKARFALLSLEAAQKSVQAPIVLPPDAQELAFGPDSIIRTSQGNQVRRVPLEVPNAAFSQQAVLDQELRQGSRYPDARNGNVDGSTVTGKGVQALMSGFDTQVRTGQAMFARTFERLVRKALMVDEVIFGEITKTIRGNADGAPYEVAYKASRDIKGDYTVDVQYGLMAGLDPNRALVFGLQARGDKLISRDFLRRQMPFALNASEEEQQVDVEEMRDALKGAVNMYAQSIPALAAQGQDPGDALAKLSTIIIGRQKGEPIEKIVSEAFAPPEPDPASAGVEGAGGDPLAGPSAGGSPMDALASEGGRPDVQTLLASMGSGGSPQLSAGVKRQTEI